ncbi:MAG: MFS transporter [Ruminococcaceae bacterium]|nr:MFS transporter [Oscillospiraceae bacterium]
MLLLAIIALSYVAVGLPDSVLGTVWPAVYNDLNLPVSLAGYIGMTVSGCTVISCLLSTRLSARFGTGLVSAVSALMTALALIGLSFSQSPVFFFLLSIPLGMGAGTVDSALNGFVALYCSNSQMSYLHCFYGLGVTLSPYLVSLCLADDNNWRRAYITVGLIQTVISLLLFFAVPYWRKKEKTNLLKEETAPKTLTLKEMMKMPSVVLSCVVFYLICATEYTAGVWSSTFFAEYRDFTPDRAAKTAMLFYVGMTLGRFMSGVFGNKLGSKKILYICVSILLFASVIIALPLPPFAAAVGLLLFGFGMGPTFPNLSYLVPSLFGRDISSSVIGVQLASTYVGIMTLPPVFGILAEKVSAGLFPYFLFILMCLFVLASAFMMKSLKKKV